MLQGMQLPTSPSTTRSSTHRNHRHQHNRKQNTRNRLHESLNRVFRLLHHFNHPYREDYRSFQDCRILKIIKALHAVDSSKALVANTIDSSEQRAILFPKRLHQFYLEPCISVLMIKTYTNWSYHANSVLVISTKLMIVQTPLVPTCVCTSSQRWELNYRNIKPYVVSCITCTKW